MADKAQALQTFWGSLGLTAYDENSVPDSAVFPYITYNVELDSIGNQLMMHGSLWYRETTWKNITQKAQAIELLLASKKPVPIDNGYMWVFRGTPFSQRMSDPNDSDIKRIYLNIGVEFLTAY